MAAVATHAKESKWSCKGQSKDGICRVTINERAGMTSSSQMDSRGNQRTGYAEGEGMYDWVTLVMVFHDGNFSKHIQHIYKEQVIQKDERYQGAQS